MKHVVGLSGGKDSTAMALRLRILRPDLNFIYLCTPTGNEPFEMFEHWRKLEQRLESPMHMLGRSPDGKTLVETVGTANYDPEKLMTLESLRGGCLEGKSRGGSLNRGRPPLAR